MLSEVKPTPLPHLFHTHVGCFLFAGLWRVPFKLNKQKSAHFFPGWGFWLPAGSLLLHLQAAPSAAATACGGVLFSAVLGGLFAGVGLIATRREASQALVATI